MKRLLIILILSVVGISSSFSQRPIELTGFYGFSFNSQANTYYGRFNTQDNPNYGGILGVGISSDLFVELMYNRTDTRIDYYYLSDFQPLNMSTEYFQVGAQQQFGPGILKPFAAISLGMVRFNLKDSGGDFTKGDAFRFAATVGGGAKILIGDRLGIRLQARLGLPMQFNGLWVGVGTGGASAGAGFRVPMVQFDLSAGLTLRLGN